jgi:DNA mismatch repair protein MutS2
MHAAVYRALEFDRVREALAALARTPLGRNRLLALEPVSDRQVVREWLGLTGEAVSFVTAGGSLDLVAPADLVTTLATIERADEPLEPLPLLGLARFLESLRSVATNVLRATSGSATQGQLRRLASVAARVDSFTDEAAAVLRAIDPGGDVNDRASTALRDIRDALRRQRAKLRSTLDTLARSREHAKHLQDQIVTDRNGRYVLVVRAEHRDAIPGIVHGSSSSGASLYLEPLASVALNNDVVALVERERAEVHRILRMLTDAFRARGEQLDRSVDAAAELDELSAKVDLAGRTEGVAPIVADDERVEFRGARHPLLIPAVRDLLPDEAGDRSSARAPKNPVASDLLIEPPARVLVISGPNTGGKTVALKGFGLLTLMAQAGLFIPVEPGSRFAPFRSVFADIGDEQSISASLSTFSAHVTNIVEMDRALERPALVLLDEAGGGTDPNEGGALAAALLEHFRQRGAMVVATTHDEALKSYAATTDGVVGAGFGFHPDTYAPTYKLMYGAPGRSLALEIAGRLGVPAEVIADARRRQSGRESLLAAHLARVDGEIAALDRERETLAVTERTLRAERDRLLDREARLAEREATLRQRLDDRLNEKLRDARAEIDRIVKELKEKADRLGARVEDRRPGAPRLTTGDIGVLRSDARTAVGAVGDLVRVGPADPDEDQTLSEPPDVGDAVFVRSIGSDGVVRALFGPNAEIDVRGKRLRVKLTDLSKGRAVPGEASRRPASVQVQTASRLPGTTRDLVVIGATVDEAIDRAEKFLDDALLNDERRLRVVHGHGTGRLRKALTAFLREHPLVASASQAPENEGGAGATIVELKD